MDDSTSHTPPSSAEAGPYRDDRPPPPTHYILPHPPGHQATKKIQPRPPELSASHQQAKPETQGGSTQQPPAVYSHQTQRWQATPAAHHSARRPRWLTSLVAVTFLLVPLGLGWWTLVRNDEATDRSWPSSPRLKYSLEVNDTPRSNGAVIVAGSLDSFYVADRGSDASLVTRYVDGKVDWRVDVGHPVPRRVDAIDGRVFVSSVEPSDDSPLYGQKGRFDRLDPETGEVMWTITTVGLFDFRIIEDRLFITRLVEGDIRSILFEYDIDSGEELNQVSGRDLYFMRDGTFTEEGFIEVDTDGLTLGVIDLDFQPVDKRVSIEPSGSDTTVWSQHPNGWVYYSDRTAFGGIASAVGLSTTGEIQFECETAIRDAYSVDLRDGSTLAVASINGAEVLDIDGSECTSRWRIKPEGRTSIGFHQYPVVITYTDTTDEFNYDDKEFAVLDWDTGETVVTGEGDYRFNDDGEWLTFQGGIFVAQDIASGEVLWQIATTNLDQYTSIGDSIWVEPDLVAVVVADQQSSRLDVYGD